MEDEMVASMLMDKIGLDFDDSLQYCVAKKLGVESIISYDKHQKCSNPSKFNN